MSHEFLNLILAIVICIVAAKTGGYLSNRMGQPAVLGELLAGVLLGPTVFDLFHVLPVFGDAHQIEVLLETIGEFGELGVLLLMFLAGLELDLNDLLKSGAVAALAGILGVVVPVIFGFVTAVAFGASTNEAIFVGLALSATSVSISAQTLMELSVLRSRVGLALLGAAVFDDILVILLLSVASVLVLGGSGGGSEILSTILQMMLFLVGGSLLGFWLLPRLVTFINRLPIREGAVAATICSILVFAWLAEVVGGIAGITGAFMVGLFLSRIQFKHPLEERMSSIAYGIFVPIFFINIGLAVDMSTIQGDAWIYAIALTIAAIVSKILGSGVGARIGGFDSLNSLRLGIGMVSRGEVGLIVAAFALDLGLLSDENFSVVIVMVIVATLVTPLMLRAIYSGRFQDTPQPQPV